MRYYECYLAYENKEDNLENIPSTACYSGLRGVYIGNYKNIGILKSLSETTKKIILERNCINNIYITFFNKEFTANQYGTYIPMSEISNKPKTIFIKDFEYNETKEHIYNFIKLINEITPCEIVKINEIKYIQIDLLDTYDQSLIVLNFIRNLWYNPTNQFGSIINEDSYCTAFFKNCFTKEYEEPLSQLTYANKIACEVSKVNGAYGHSNINHHFKLKIKTLEELLAYKGQSTIEFLST